jgi:hypothetical protein
MPAKKKTDSKRTYKDGNQGKKGEPPNQKRRTVRAKKVAAPKKDAKDRRIDSLLKQIEKMREENKNRGNKPF